jgi:hypothetical protein
MSTPSTPGHFNEIVVIGQVDLLHVAHGHLTAILLTVSTGGDPLKIIVVPRAPPPGVQRGDTLWCRGRLACDPTPEKKSLHFIEAAHVDVIKRQKGV